MGAVSQWEREAVGERTRDALRHKMQNGQRAGSIPFGYRLCGDRKHIEIDPTEHGSVREIRRLRRGGLPLRRIASTLNEEGHRTGAGRNGDWNQ